jgi:hypothetical protein
MKMKYKNKLKWMLKAEEEKKKKLLLKMCYVFSIIVFFRKLSLPERFLSWFHVSARAVSIADRMR